LPKAEDEAGLAVNAVLLDDSIWPQIVRPLGFDGGIRSLQRTIQTVVRKIAREVVEGNMGPYRINNENIGNYLGN